MARSLVLPIKSFRATVSLLLLYSATAAAAAVGSDGAPRFWEVPQFYNSPGCPLLLPPSSTASCSPLVMVYVAMTLDIAYLRGSMAVVVSILCGAHRVVYLGPDAFKSLPPFRPPLGQDPDPSSTIGDGIFSASSRSSGEAPRSRSDSDPCSSSVASSPARLSSSSPPTRPPLARGSLRPSSCQVRKPSSGKPKGILNLSYKLVEALMASPIAPSIFSVISAAHRPAVTVYSPLSRCLPTTPRKPLGRHGGAERRNMRRRRRRRRKERGKRKENKKKKKREEEERKQKKRKEKNKKKIEEKNRGRRKK